VICRAQADQLFSDAESFLKKRREIVFWKLRATSLHSLHSFDDNAHAQSIICSWAMFSTNAHAQTIICTQLFAGKWTNQNWEYYKKWIIISRSRTRFRFRRESSKFPSISFAAT
jgi:hypothetical protein